MSSNTQIWVQHNDGYVTESAYTSGDVTNIGGITSGRGITSKGGVSVPYVTLVIGAINVLVYLYSVVAEGFAFSFDVGASVIANGGLFGRSPNINWETLNDLADTFGMESADLLDGLTQMASQMASTQSYDLTGSEYVGIAGGEYYRLITHGFIHADFTHLIFNLGYLLIVGCWLETKVGCINFVCIFFVAMLGGACGALLLSPDSITVGASGAIFGVQGSMLALMGKKFWRSVWCGFLIFDIVSTFTIMAEGIVSSTESEVSIGGHIGGFLMGILIGAIVSKLWKAKVTTAFASVALSACLLAFAHMISAP